MTRGAWVNLRSRYRFACRCDRAEAQANAEARRRDDEYADRRPGPIAPYWPSRRWQAAVVDALPPVLRVQLQAQPATADQIDPRSRNLRAIVRFHAERRYKASILRDALRRVAATFPAASGSNPGAPLASAGAASLSHPAAPQGAFQGASQPGFSSCQEHSV